MCLGATPLVAICTPPNGAMVSRTLHHDDFEMHRRDWRGVDPTLAS